MTVTRGDEAQLGTVARAPASCTGPVLAGLVPVWWVADLFGNDPSHFMAGAMILATLLTVLWQHRWYQPLPALALLHWAWDPRFDLGLVVGVTILATVGGIRWYRAAPVFGAAVWLTLVGLHGARIGTILAVLAVGPTVAWALALCALPLRGRWARVARCVPVAYPALLAIAAAQVLAPGIRVPFLLVAAVTAFLGLCGVVPAVGERVAGAVPALAAAGTGHVAGAGALAPLAAV
ncbi:MAG: hypothetical protein JWM47_1708, partial [Acidimicrobiales bacterium]|nr:hypothetical protein [Acidimicrobiales bacterium]